MEKASINRGEPVIALDDLSVSYGGHRALQGVSLSVTAGAVGLLGPNGAGKTTLIRVLLGLVRPQAAHVSIAGIDPRSVRGRRLLRRRVGYMPEEPCLLPGMNAVEMVTGLARIAGMRSVDAMIRAHEVLDYVGLDEARFREVAGYSAGMQQRVKLAQCLVHDPEILLLDEPTNGLDPRGRAHVLDLIRELATVHGKTVLLCSHLLPDVQRACSSVIVLAAGQVRATGVIEELTRDDGRWLRVRLAGQPAAFAEQLREHGVEHTSDRDEALRVRLPPDAADAEVLFTCARASGTVIRGIVPVQQSLDDVFADLLEPGGTGA